MLMATIRPMHKLLTKLLFILFFFLVLVPTSSTLLVTSMVTSRVTRPLSELVRYTVFPFDFGRNYILTLVVTRNPYKAVLITVLKFLVLTTFRELLHFVNPGYAITPNEFDLSVTEEKDIDSNTFITRYKPSSNFVFPFSLRSIVVQSAKSRDAIEDRLEPFLANPASRSFSYVKNLVTRCTPRIVSRILKGSHPHNATFVALHDWLNFIVIKIFDFNTIGNSHYDLVFTSVSWSSVHIQTAKLAALKLGDLSKTACFFSDALELEAKLYRLKIWNTKTYDCFRNGYDILKDRLFAGSFCSINITERDSRVKVACQAMSMLMRAVCFKYRTEKAPYDIFSCTSSANLMINKGITKAIKTMSA